MVFMAMKFFSRKIGRGLSHLGLKSPKIPANRRSKEKLMACKQHNLRSLSCQQILKLLKIFRCCQELDFEQKFIYNLYYMTICAFLNRLNGVFWMNQGVTFTYFT